MKWLLDGDPLRSRIHERRLLPRVHTINVRDGMGDGRLCEGCGSQVLHHEPAVEALAWRAMYFHAECFDIWDRERHAIPGIGSEQDDGIPCGRVIARDSAASTCVVIDVAVGRATPSDLDKSPRTSGKCSSSTSCCADRIRSFWVWLARPAVRYQKAAKLVLRGEPIEIARKLREMAERTIRPKGTRG